MQVLITGKGTSGSWKIRGEQLGRAIGATVIQDARDVAAYDLVVLVKRPPPGLLERIKKAGVPWCWDVVDAWPQPQGNEWDRATCMAWWQSQPRSNVIAATERMAADLGGWCLPHHSWPGKPVNPVRKEVKRVGYQGGDYLGSWKRILQRECTKRGWEFIENPASLSDLDIAVALRAANGYAPRHWKSNVKLANAQGSGTPVICNRESGYIETASGAEKWADTEAELVKALDELTPHQARVEASCTLLKAAPTLEMIAKRYSQWLTSTALRS